MPLLKYSVNRYRFWATGKWYVEVATEGYYFKEADTLIEQYENEGVLFSNPLEAAQVAVKIFEIWSKFLSNRYFRNYRKNPIELKWDGVNHSVTELLEKATYLYGQIAKCAKCNVLMIEGNYQDVFDYPDLKFCSSKCLKEFDFSQY